MSLWKITHDWDMQLKTVSANLSSETKLLAQKQGERIAETARLADLRSKADVLGEVETELAIMQPQLDKLKKDVNSLKNLQASRTASVEAEDKSLEELRRDANRVSSELNNLRGEKIALQNLFETLKGTLKGEIASLSSQKEVLVNETDYARGEFAEIEGKITALKTTILPSLKQKEADLNKRINGQSSRSALLEEEIRDLELAKAALSPAQRETVPTPTGALKEAPLDVDPSEGEN